MQTSDPRSCLWTATAIAAPATPPLAGERRADVVVVGGGFTGLSAALHAAEGGADTVLLEAAAPGFGASGRNNGQVIPGYVRHNPDDIERLYGPEQGGRMNAFVMASSDLVFDLIARHGIECEASRQGWLQPAHRANRLGAIRAKHDQWAARGAPVEWLDRARTAELVGSDVYHGAWLHRSGGHIQPLGFARGLAHAAIAAGAAIHAESPALAVERSGTEWRVRTPAGAVVAPKVILATNAYTDRLWPGLKQSIVPVRSFHVATRPLGDNVAKTILPYGHGLSDTRQALWAFRKDARGRLISTAMPFTTWGARGVLREAIARRLGKIFPQAADAGFEHIWDGKVAMTLDRLPRYHELADGVVAGLGYSGRGIAIGTAMGRFMAERVTGRAPGPTPFPVSAPDRIPFHGIAVPAARLMVLAYRWKDARG